MATIHISDETTIKSLRVIAKSLHYLIESVHLLPQVTRESIINMHAWLVSHPDSSDHQTDDKEESACIPYKVGMNRADLDTAWLSQFREGKVTDAETADKLAEENYLVRKPEVPASSLDSELDSDLDACATSSTSLQQDDGPILQVADYMSHRVPSAPQIPPAGLSSLAHYASVVRSASEGCLMPRSRKQQYTLSSSLLVEQDEELMQRVKHDSLVSYENELAKNSSKKQESSMGKEKLSGTPSSTEGMISEVDISPQDREAVTEYERLYPRELAEISSTSTTEQPKGYPLLHSYPAWYVLVAVRVKELNDTRRRLGKDILDTETAIKMRDEAEPAHSIRSEPASTEFPVEPSGTDIPDDWETFLEVDPEAEDEDNKKEGSKTES